jgi:pimeloyl-ACP methyl ester carboxylesterase
MQSGTARIRDLTLFYRTLGDGPDVLLIHGWASSSRTWLATMSSLAAHFRCWALDLYGFGDSDKPYGDCYNIPGYVDLITEFAQALGIRQAAVVGHSMGGMIALALSATSSLVNRLVVVNPVVTGRVRLPLASLEARRRLRRPLVALARHAWPAASALALQLAGAGWPLPAGPDFFRGTPDSLLGCLRALTGYDTTPLLPAITAPTLVVVGDRDMVISPAEGELAARHIRGARLEVLQGGHRIFDDQPARFEAALCSFLAVPERA